MAFSRDDLKAYESQPQKQDPNHDPWDKNTPAVATVEETPVDSSATDVTEPPVEDNDGSTTENQAETVAAEDANPEGDKDTDIEEPADGRQPRNRAQERISELVDERNAVREYNKFLQTKLDELLRKG